MTTAQNGHVDGTNDLATVAPAAPPLGLAGVFISEVCMRQLLRRAFVAVLASLPAPALPAGLAYDAAEIDRHREARRILRAKMYPRGPSKLGRRLRRKAQLGMTGAY